MKKINLNKSTVKSTTPARATKKAAFKLNTISEIFVNGARAVDTVACDMFAAAVYGFGRAAESFEKSLKAELKERLGKEGYGRFKPQATRVVKAATYVLHTYKSDILRIVENAESDEAGIESIKNFLKEKSLKNYKCYELYKKEKNGNGNGNGSEKGGLTPPPAPGGLGRAGDSGVRYLDSALAVVETAESISDIVASINAIVMRSLDYFYTADDLDKLHEVFKSNAIKLSKLYKHPSAARVG